LIKAAGSHYASFVNDIELYVDGGASQI